MIESVKPNLGRPINREARAERRAQILEGARVCFIRDGFHKATIASIGQEARVNVASIYQYFKNKDAVIEGLVEQIAFLEISDLKSFNPDRFDYVSLRKFVEQIYIGDDRREAAALRAEIISEAARNPKISNYVVETSAKTIQALAQFVKKFQERGDIPADLDAQSAAEDLAYFHEGIQLHIPLTRDDRSKLLEIHVKFVAARLCVPGHWDS